MARMDIGTNTSLTITLDGKEHSLFEFRVAYLMADASDLGLGTRAKSWRPQTLPTNAGNKEPFTLASQDTDHARYTQPGSRFELCIFND